ncbi:MAG: MOSC domain-containing protein [Candidatus Baltobacteraceae bacterium]
MRRYPVKSLRGEILDSAEVTESGIAGDRVNALFVREGHARVGKTYRGKEHEGLQIVSDPAAARDLARRRGIELEERHGERFFDEAPISLLIDRWLDDLSAWLGYRAQWERFRPNLFVRAALDVPPESAFVGAELRLGDVRLRVRMPNERCVVVNYHPKGDPSDPRVLRLLAERRNAIMGIYCDVVEPGIVRTGDALVSL